MKPPQKGARRLDVDGRTWWWLVGESLAMVLWTPTGEKHLTTAAAVKKLDSSTVERGQHKGTSDGAVTPEHVRQYARTLVV